MERNTDFTKRTITYVAFDRIDGNQSDFMSEKEAVKYCKLTMKNYPLRTQYIMVWEKDKHSESSYGTFIKQIGISNNPDIKLDINY